MDGDEEPRSVEELDAELSALDRGAEGALLREAELLYDKGWALADTSGPEAALPLYVASACRAHQAYAVRVATTP